MYVDDFISGSVHAQFDLHKWNSNVEELEHNDHSDGEESFAKQQLGPLARGVESKLLGLPWNKREDTLSVIFLGKSSVMTKRGILSALASVYNPLGFVSPTMLEGKLVYREACRQKTAWDAPLPTKVTEFWMKFESKLPSSVSTQRSLAPFQEPLDEVKMHAFGDASGKGVSASVYAVVSQTYGTTQGFLTAKSRVAKQGPTIPRLELIAGHQPRKPGSLYLRGLRLRPWWQLVTWDYKNLLPKGEREKCQITCFHIKTLHFICKERGLWSGALCIILYNIEFSIQSSKCLLFFSLFLFAFKPREQAIYL